MKQKRTIRKDGTVKIETINELPSRTKKGMREMVNVNAILRKYRQTGILTHVSSKDGTYGDFSEIKDFAGALNTVIKAKEQFELLPAEVRSRFGNNPQELIKFLQDPKNVDESVKLGLRVKKEPPKNVNTQSASQQNGDSKPN